MKNHSQPRQWNLRDQTGRTEAEWGILIQDLKRQTGLSTLTLRVCVLRGLETAAAIEAYLCPRFENLTHPFQIRDMDRAVDRLVQSRNKSERIRIFGDYDVDGTTGAALLFWMFHEFGFELKNIDVRQPDRFKDGYGLNIGAVEAAVQEGVHVLVTVDCGITSFEAASRAQELGLELIIVDHHQLDLGKGLPPAHSVINPQRADCESGLKQLCGCGLAFYLAMALRSRGRQEGWFLQGGEPNLKKHLDLVVIATAADMVPLIGDNRILVRYGLEVLKHSQKPGVKALMDAAGLGSKDLSPSHLGFVLGPRINASGRMQSASLALELLTTMDSLRAADLAFELERLNEERAIIQNQIWDEIRIRVEQGLAQGKYRNGIVVADSKWHEGVVGIVASRVTETFRKPAAVIALREDLGKGSVRSFGGKDVLAALRACSSTLIGFGGHRHAAGLSLSLDRVEEFVKAFDQALEKIEFDSQGGALFVEGACSLEEFSVQNLQELERLGPFGPGNPEPVFTVTAKVKHHRVLKGRHLKLSLAAFEGGASLKQGSEIEAIWFHAAEREDILSGELMAGGREWAAVPELNRFRGQMTPTLRVRDWRSIEVG